MSEHYPRIRFVHARSGHPTIGDGLTLDFYMKRMHQDCAPAALRALQAYSSAVGTHRLNLATDAEGDWQDIEGSSCEYFQREIHAGQYVIFHLTNSSAAEGHYRFDYHGKSPTGFLMDERPDAMSAVSFWLPTEYLEKHGPSHVRELALEIAATLPFCSGYVGLAFHCPINFLGTPREVLKLCCRYPGMDIPDVSSMAWHLGSRLRGPAWLTLLGQPLLGALGGVEGLRARLHSPETTVQEMSQERAVVTLGPWPEAGDTEQGQFLPAYRELARVTEPWLYHRRPLLSRYFPPDEWRRWERRFLDEG